MLELWKRALEKPQTCLLSSSTFPSPSALGYGYWAVGQAPLWPDLGCSACTLEGSCFSSGLHRVPWHPVPGLLMVSQLLFPHPPPQWWTYPGCSSCIYFQSRPKEQFPNRSIHSVVLLGPSFEDKRAGNSWGVAGIPPPPPRSVASALIPKMSLSGRQTPRGHLPAQLPGTESTACKQTTDLKCREIFKAYPKQHGRVCPRIFYQYKTP